MEFSERLSELMEEREITAYKLSKDTGIAQSTLSEVINNKNKTLSTQNITKIANYFGCTIDYLLGRSPFRSPSETRYSITVAAIKKILHGETFKALGYDELIWKAAIDITELLYADDAVAFIKSLHKKQNPTDAEYYKLSKFVTASINWPDDFSGPVALNIQGEKITVPLNYWDIPRIRFFEGYFDEPGSEYAAVVKEPAALYEGIDIAPDKNLVTSYNELTQRLGRVHCIPVLGSIPAGYAVEAVEDIVERIEIPEEWLNGGREYFGLLVRGDSMYPEYLEGDVVVIRKQSCCDSGDDCVVMLNNMDATLKRVHVYEDGIELEAINPMYGKKKFNNEEVHALPVTILGVVVELRRKKK